MYEFWKTKYENMVKTIIILSVTDGKTNMIFWEKKIKGDLLGLFRKQSIHGIILRHFTSLYVLFSNFLIFNF